MTTIPATDTIPETGTDCRRRRFLGSMTGAALSAAFAASALPVGAAVGSSGHVHSGTTISGVYDVSSAPYNAKGDGVTNDAPAIQAAINAAISSTGYGTGGGIVWLPAGNYLIGSAVTIPSQIVLEGAGWGAPYPEQGGTMLIVGSTAFSPLTITGRGTVVRNLALFHNQPAEGNGGSWPGPSAFPAAINITAGGDDVRLENLLLVNPTIGISCQDVGRVTMSRIFGQPMKTGIYVDNAEDVVKIDNVHFWPFWHSEPSVVGYTLANGTAIESRRSDNPHFSNIFCLGYQTGLHFGSSSHGITSKFRLSNVDCDLCYQGIFIDGSGTTGQISNFTSQGPSSPFPAANNGLFIQAENVTVQATNVRVTDTNNNGIRVEGSGNFLFLENVWVESWNQSKGGFPGIEVYGASTISVGFGRAFTGTSSGAPSTGATTGHIALDS